MVPKKIDIPGEMKIFAADGSLVFTTKLNNSNLNETFNLQLISGIYYISIS